MNVILLPPKGFCNTYLVTEDGVHAVAIDAGHPAACRDASDMGYSVDAVLLTHGHFDHTQGCAAFARAGAKIGCLEEERPLLFGAANVSGLFESTLEEFPVDFCFRGGETLSLCGMTFEVIATPGHTAGSCCFKAGNVLFTGDTLFMGGIGRTDFPTGDPAALRNSLKTLAKLQNCDVYPGHGAATTLLREKEHGYLLM